MREFGLSTTISAPAERVWSLLTDFETYEQWNSLVPQGRGSAVEGDRLELRIVRPSGQHVVFHPVVVEVAQDKELVLAATILHRRVLHMVHYLTLVPKSSNETILVQRWIVSGIMGPVMWSVLKKRMARFEIFGNDLKAAAEARGPSGISGVG